MVDGDPNNKLSTKEVYVRFSSDGNVNYKGFNFTFVAKSDSCKSRLQSSSKYKMLKPNSKFKPNHVVDSVVCLQFMISLTASNVRTQPPNNTTEKVLPKAKFTLEQKYPDS